MAHPETLRKRVAHHEAAHAVLIVACGFKLGETFLTPSATADGTLGGFTGWANPVDPWKNPSAKTFELFGEQVAIVLYGGQYAELRLRELDDTVQVPEREPNWQNDDDEARRVLSSEPLRDRHGFEQLVRDATRANVERLWTPISLVASELLEPFPDAERQTVKSSHPDGKLLVPVSRVLVGDEVIEVINRALPPASAG
jgi:hypothetical protein